MKPDNDIDPISAALRPKDMRRRITLLTLIPIVVAAILIGVTSYQVSRATKDLDAALDSTRLVRASLKSAEADLLASTELKAKLDAGIDSLRKKYNMSPDSLAALLSAVDARTSELLANSRAAEKITPRVYIHIVSEDQRDKAREVEDFLESLDSKKLVVPGIELVSTGPSTSELRFFRSGEKEEAEKILRIVNIEGYNLRLRDLSRQYENSRAIRPGHYEIWFGEDF